MARIPVVFAEGADWGFEGGPGYLTGVVDLENGFEDRDSQWKYPKHEYSAAFSNMKEDSRDYFISIFHACRGRRHSFMFKDYNDYFAVDEPLNVEAGTTNTVQLYKTYTFGPVYTIRPIQALKEATIYNEAGTPIAGTLNLQTGEFTPSSPWGTGQHTWDGEYYVWVRFDDDYNPMTIATWQTHSVSVKLVEDKFAFESTNVPESWEE